MPDDLHQARELARTVRRLLHDLLQRDTGDDQLTWENASATLAWCANEVSKLPDLSADSAPAWLSSLPGVKAVLLFLGEYLAPPPLPPTPPARS
jgi:hypothetical protein